MSSSEKFLFGDDFSVPEEVRIEKKRKAEEPVAPMFTEEQVAQIKAAAYDEGRQSGMLEAQQNAQTALNGIMQQILEAVHQSMSYLEQIARFNEQEAIHLAYTIAHKVAPHAVAQFPRAEIDNLLHDCLDKMHSEPRMIIRVNTEMAPEVEELIGGIAQQSGFEGRILMKPDAAMALPDIQVEWTNGGVSRTMQDVVNEIESIISAYMTPPEPDATAMPEGHEGPDPHAHDHVSPEEIQAHPDTQEMPSDQGDQTAGHTEVPA